MLVLLLPTQSPFKKTVAFIICFTCNTCIPTELMKFGELFESRLESYMHYERLENI
jgi:hypothetical protein